MNKKTTEIETPNNATEPVSRMQFAETTEAIHTAWASRNGRTTVTAEQGE